MNELEKEIDKFTKISYKDVCDSISDEWVGMGGERCTSGGYETGSDALQLRIGDSLFPVFEYQVYLPETNKPDFQCVHSGTYLDLDRSVCVAESMLQLGGGYKDRDRITVIDIYHSGIKDLLNIQPHEYGILKLKYGVERDSLFIPKIFHGIVRAIYKELGLV